MYILCECLLCKVQQVAGEARQYHAIGEDIAIVRSPLFLCKFFTTIAYYEFPFVFVVRWLQKLSFIQFVTNFLM